MNDATFSDNLFNSYRLRGNDMFLLLLVEPGHALDSHIVRLRGSTREDDFSRVCTHQICHLLQNSTLLLSHWVYSDRNTVARRSRQTI